MSVEYIKLEDCVLQYDIEMSFMDALLEAGLIQLYDDGEDERRLPYHQLKSLEKYIVLHYELDINVEGIEALHHMTEKLLRLQEENERLKKMLDVLPLTILHTNKYSTYEPG